MPSKISIEFTADEWNAIAHHCRVARDKYTANVETISGTYNQTPPADRVDQNYLTQSLAVTFATQARQAQAFAEIIIRHTEGIES